MNCRRCRAENPATSRYCSACGALLPGSLVKPNGTIPRPYIVGAAALAVLVAAYFLLPGLRSSARRSGSAEAGPPAQGASRTAPAESAPASPAVPIVAGRFILDGFLQGGPAMLEGALFDGSWAALPLWALLGPSAPRLDGPGPAGVNPASVDLRLESPVVLCRFDLDGNPQTPELAPYNQSAVLEWLPLSGGRTSSAIEPGPLRTAGSFKSFALFKGIDAPGALVQAGRLVGWTFGQGIEFGYLWAPADGSGPKALMSLTGLAGFLRPYSRETAFVRAMSLPEDATADRRLAAFAAGFRSPPLLSSGDLPIHLKPAVVAARMADLTSSMIRQNMAEEAARILGPELLAEASDILLIRSAAAAFNAARGFDAAHRLLADLRREPAMRETPAFRELDTVEIDLAKNALHAILNEGGYNGLEIYDEASRLAPDDLELHLLGVEAAVLEKQWGRAGDLLQAKQYPAELSDKARTLGRLIEEGLREEDSATIRFNPGDKLIPVFATINKRLRQKFFIDTGATRTIIPTSAVAALGIPIDESTPVVGLQGVAGADLAFEVRLETIEIEGQAVFDIRALVYDLGESEDAGLLGNDVLQHFQVDLDSIKGILKLRKK